jgi:hypothetical protein
MQNRETQQINEFELIDDHGSEYTIFEHQEGVQKRFLKWIKAGQSWFRLSDGTPVDKVNENTFKIASTDKVLYRPPQQDWWWGSGIGIVLVAALAESAAGSALALITAT